MSISQGSEKTTKLRAIDLEPQSREAQVAALPVRTCNNANAPTPLAARNGSIHWIINGELYGLSPGGAAEVIAKGAGCSVWSLVRGNEEAYWWTWYGKVFAASVRPASP